MWKEVVRIVQGDSGKGDKKAENEAVRELDRVVFDVLGLAEDERRQVYEGLESLRRIGLVEKS